MINSHNRPTRGYGWVFYDDNCPRCSRWVHRFTRVLVRKHILTAPLQRGWVQQRLELDANDAFIEMKVLTAGGNVLGGANAMVYLAERIWWARPLAVIAKLPGAMRLLHLLYKKVAANRHNQCICPTNIKVSSRNKVSATQTKQLLTSEPGRTAPVHVSTKNTAHAAMNG